MNFTGAPVPLPGQVLLASVPVEDGLLAPDGCAWVRLNPR